MAKRIQKKAVAVLIKEVWKEINSLIQKYDFYRENFAKLEFSAPTVARYIGWCQRNKLESGKRENLDSYFGLNAARKQETLNIAFLEAKLGQAWGEDRKQEISDYIKGGWRTVITVRHNISGSEYHSRAKFKVQITYEILSKYVTRWTFSGHRKSWQSEGTISLRPKDNMDWREFIAELIMTLGGSFDKKTDTFDFQSDHYRRPPRPFKTWRRYNRAKSDRKWRKQWKNREKAQADKIASVNVVNKTPETSAE